MLSQEVCMLMLAAVGHSGHKTSPCYVPHFALLWLFWNCTSNAHRHRNGGGGGAVQGVHAPPQHFNCVACPHCTLTIIAHTRHNNNYCLVDVCRVLWMWLLSLVDVCRVFWMWFYVLWMCVVSCGCCVWFCKAKDHIHKIRHTSTRHTYYYRYYVCGCTVNSGA